ncbi:branched-chain amino acid ABC transporter permease [Variovorax sp. J31P207]|uniref:branched-chain amino acid ABC transporter permease n=1 Tax=Variovorax sp. J31P207 TaxID=3053510 RepID=UPI002577099E|nr:branched-chain amino acid ABC transporter permease [Variovorax sp. J31P207]MDM0065251.1 branched-chain amino acid ABC transporter permease [Variovorax sp. J31P207]
MKYAVPVVAFLAAAPLALQSFQVTLLTEILIFALFAMSLDVQMGYARLFSFGHVLPYGVGAYACAFALLAGWPLPFALGGAVLVATLLSVPIGWLSTRASGIAFAMLTLAFAQLGYAIVFKWNTLTGGSDGLTGFARNAGPFGFEGFVSRDGYFWLVLVVVFATYWLTRGFMNSAMGRAIVAVRENERRASAIGYVPRTLRIVAFVVSGALAGVAGALHAGFLLFVSPEILHWMLSGHVIIAVILGGTGTLIGPMIGAALIILAHHQLSAITDSWPLVMGLLFIIVVIAAPKGLWGIKTSISAKISQRRAPHVGEKNAAS